MRFEKIYPSESLKPYIRYYAISEALEMNTYKVFPSTGLVMGFQYLGKLSSVKDTTENELASSGITGLQESFRIFKNDGAIGTVLIYFTEIGASHFFKIPINEFYSESVSLENFINKYEIEKIETLLAESTSDANRIKTIETFLLSQIIEKQGDKLVLEAIKSICISKGTLKIKELADSLFISQSPFEKRFRKIVGTSPKKFASLVRFNSVLETMNSEKPLTEIGYENNYFDQSHFIKDFKQFTGETPEKFGKTNLE